MRFELSGRRPERDPITLVYNSLTPVEFRPAEFISLGYTDADIMTISAAGGWGGTLRFYSGGSKYYGAPGGGPGGGGAARGQRKLAALPAICEVIVGAAGTDGAQVNKDSRTDGPYTGQPAGTNTGYSSPNGTNGGDSSFAYANTSSDLLRVHAMGGRAGEGSFIRPTDGTFVQGGGGRGGGGFRGIGYGGGSGAPSPPVSTSRPGDPGYSSGYVNASNNFHFFGGGGGGHGGSWNLTDNVLAAAASAGGASGVVYAPDPNYKTNAPGGPIIPWTFTGTPGGLRSSPGAGAGAGIKPTPLRPGSGAYGSRTADAITPNGLVVVRLTAV